MACVVLTCWPWQETLYGAMSPKSLDIPAEERALSLLYRWWNWGIEEGSHFSKITQGEEVGSGEEAWEVRGSSGLTFPKAHTLSSSSCSDLRCPLVRILLKVGSPPWHSSTSSPAWSRAWADPPQASWVLLEKMWLKLVSPERVCFKASKAGSKRNVHNFHGGLRCWVYFQLALCLGIHGNIRPPGKTCRVVNSEMESGKMRIKTKPHLQRMLEFWRQLGTWNPYCVDSGWKKNPYLWKRELLQPAFNCTWKGA